MRTLLKILLGVVALLVGAVLFRTLILRPGEAEAPHPVRVEVDSLAVDRFAGALRFATLSPEDSAFFDPGPFQAFAEYLKRAFPRVHEDLTLEMVGGHSLLYTWAGADTELPPVILLAHSDVVPIEPGTEGDWTHPPFSGRIVDGEVWGRGAMDDKASLMAILEGAEILLERGYTPDRTLLLAFGHDEEVGGGEGAAAVASLLAGRGIRGAYVLDEGMAIVEGTFPGIGEPVALLGLAEKGYMSLLLSVEVEGGHSSMPPESSAIGILAGAVGALESHPMPARLDGPSRMLLEELAPHAPFGTRLVLGNLWLFRGLVTHLMARVPEMNAALRTTTAPTLFQAGVKDNVLPSRAQAVVNFRILPGDSGEDVLGHAREAVADSRVRVEIYRGPPRDPSPISSPQGPGYGEIEATIREVFPGTLVAPFLTLGGTDSKHYAGVAEDVYRFAPLRFSEDYSQGVHGTNERIPVRHYLDMVRFYARLMERAGSAPLS